MYLVYTLQNGLCNYWGVSFIFCLSFQLLTLSSYIYHGFKHVYIIKLLLLFICRLDITCDEVSNCESLSKVFVTLH